MKTVETGDDGINMPETILTDPCLPIRAMQGKAAVRQAEGPVNIKLLKL